MVAEVVRSTFGLAGEIESFPYRYHYSRTPAVQNAIVPRLGVKRGKLGLRSDHVHVKGRIEYHIQSLTIDPINVLRCDPTGFRGNYCYVRRHTLLLVAEPDCLPN